MSKEQEIGIEERLFPHEEKDFKLVPKMTLNMCGVLYKVIAVRPNGKATIKPIEDIRRSTLH